MSKIEEYRKAELMSNIYDELSDIKNIVFLSFLLTQIQSLKKKWGI